MTIGSRRPRFATGLLDINNESRDALARVPQALETTWTHFATACVKLVRPFPRLVRFTNAAGR